MQLQRKMFEIGHLIASNSLLGFPSISGIPARAPHTCTWILICPL